MPLFPPKAYQEFTHLRGVADVEYVERGLLTVAGPSEGPGKAARRSAREMLEGAILADLVGLYKTKPAGVADLAKRLAQKLLANLFENGAASLPSTTSIFHYREFGPTNELRNFEQETSLSDTEEKVSDRLNSPYGFRVNMYALEELYLRPLARLMYHAIETADPVLFEEIGHWLVVASRRPHEQMA